MTRGPASGPHRRGTGFTLLRHERVRLQTSKEDGIRQGHPHTIHPLTPHSLSQSLNPSGTHAYSQAQVICTVTQSQTLTHAQHSHTFKLSHPPSRILTVTSAVTYPLTAPHSHSPAQSYSSHSSHSQTFTRKTTHLVTHIVLHPLTQMHTVTHSLTGPCCPSSSHLAPLDNRGSATLSSHVRTQEGEAVSGAGPRLMDTHGPTLAGAG